MKNTFSVTIWHNEIDGERLFDSDFIFSTFERALACANNFASGNKLHAATIWRNGCRLQDIG